MSETTVYEIINPSDPYSIVASDPRTVFWVAILLGQGSYGFDPVGDNGAERVPLFLFGGAEEWWDERYDVAPQQWYEENRISVADALDTVMLGPPTRRSPDDMPDASVHDDGRTSMNDIGRAAWELAENIREKAADDA